jgi:hypothetical protein
VPLLDEDERHCCSPGIDATIIEEGLGRPICLMARNPVDGVQYDGFNVVRHREDAHGAERERDPPPITAFI